MGRSSRAPVVSGRACRDCAAGESGVARLGLRSSAERRGGGHGRPLPAAVHQRSQPRSGLRVSGGRPSGKVVLVDPPTLLTPAGRALLVRLTAVSAVPALVPGPCVDTALQEVRE